MTDEAENTEVVEGIGGEAEESTMPAGEIQARGKGWTDKDAWIEAGKDEAEWANYGVFNKNGSLYAEISKLKDANSQNDEAISNLNKLHAVSLNQAKAEYEKQKDEAIADGNVAEVRKIDRDIQALEATGGESAKSDTTLLTDWNTENDWIYDESTPEQRSKVAYAKNQFESAKAKGLNVAQILSSVNEAMADRYTQNGDVNHRRNDPSTSQSGGANENDAKPVKATLSNMTAEESHLRKTAFHSMNDKDFLKLLNDSRK